jgi:hypothetical protein
MFKCINFSEFMCYLFDDEKLANKAGEIVKALLEAQSPRISNIAEKMKGSSGSCYKAIQRFLGQVNLKKVLWRLFQEEAEFVIGDPTEMPRHKAPKTSYVGKLKDGETPGYWLMVLSTPFRGRAIPFHFITYSSRTIGSQVTSRNQEHFRAFNEIKSLLGERPLVLDREFSYLELLQGLELEQIRFVIRLNLGDQRKQPHLSDADGQPIKLFIQPGQTVIHRKVFYLGVVQVSLVGFWRKGLSTSMWIMTNLEPERALQIYQARMKTEETFRDCKDLLHLPKVMNKQQQNLEKMIALTLIAYVVALLVGEAIRDVTYGKVEPANLHNSLLASGPNPASSQRKWLLYSGPFVLLKQKPKVPDDILASILLAVIPIFAALVYGNVRSFV